MGNPKNDKYKTKATQNHHHHHPPLPNQLRSGYSSFPSILSCCNKSTQNTKEKNRKKKHPIKT